MRVRRWRAKILDALKEERDAIPGRAGATPLSRMADELRELSSAPGESAIAGDAIVSLINDPDNNLDDLTLAEYWGGLSYLSQYLRFYDKRKLVSALRARLFGPDSVRDDLKVHVLNGLIMTSERLNPIELTRLESVRREAPVAWLNAAVMSGLFAMAREYAIELLRTDAIATNALVFCLESWRQVWEGSEFGSFVTDLRDATNSDEAKVKLANWMRRRGFSEKGRDPEKGGIVVGPAIMSKNSVDKLIAARLYWVSPPKKQIANRVMQSNA